MENELLNNVMLLTPFVVASIFYAFSWYVIRRARLAQGRVNDTRQSYLLILERFLLVLIVFFAFVVLALAHDLTSHRQEDREALLRDTVQATATAQARRL